MSNQENNGVFNEFSIGENNEPNVTENPGTIRSVALTETGFWNRFKSFWLQDIPWDREITVELTPHQQKIENEVNEFLHQEITWDKVQNFLFKEVKFGK